MVREPPEGREKRAALARMYLLEAVNGHDHAALKRFVGEDGPESPFGQLDRFEPTIRDGLDAADLRVDFEQTVSEGEWVAIRGVVRTATDCMAPASGDDGPTFSFDCVWFVHIQGEQIDAVWSLADTLTLSGQLESEQQHDPSDGASN